MGFSQRVRLEWLERTAHLALAGNDKSSIQKTLTEMLKDNLSVNRVPSGNGSGYVRGTREKVITILMKIWVHPPLYLHGLHQKGLELLSRLPHEHHVVVHWGMTMAVYPFWGRVASHVGRLLRLQGTATHAQVRRRIVEQYGQRPTVKVAVRRVLRSMVDWGVLNDAKRDSRLHTTRTYVPGLSFAVDQVELIAWLAEAMLYTHSDGLLPLNTILRSTCLFPFQLYPVPAIQLTRANEQLDMVRHGLNQDLIMLRSKERPPKWG